MTTFKSGKALKAEFDELLERIDHASQGNIFWYPGDPDYLLEAQKEMVGFVRKYQEQILFTDKLWWWYRGGDAPYTSPDLTEEQRGAKGPFTSEQAALNVQRQQNNAT